MDAYLLHPQVWNDYFPEPIQSRNSKEWMNIQIELNTNLSIGRSAQHSVQFDVGQMFLLYWGQATDQGMHS